MPKVMDLLKSANESQFLSLQSISFPGILAVITAFQKADAPIWLVIGLGIVGASAFLATDIVRTKIPEERCKMFVWWVARLAIWVFNTAVVIGSVIYLST